LSNFNLPIEVLYIYSPNCSFSLVIEFMTTIVFYKY